MAEQQQPELQFLTVEECAEVDKALLSSREKFSARLAIYALRVLKQIAEPAGFKIENVTPEQIGDWIVKDEKIQQQIEIDSGFDRFFTNLVISSLKPLKQISQEASVPIEDLTVQQVVAWFEKDAKSRRGL